MIAKSVIAGYPNGVSSFIWIFDNNVVFRKAICIISLTANKSIVAAARVNIMVKGIITTSAI